MSKNGIRVEEFNIFALGGVPVSYHLKDIHTIALQVTGERIGGVALELGLELLYNIEDPYLKLNVARGPKEDPENDREFVIRPGDWLVILWDEIHKFRDPEFRSTFSFDELSNAGDPEMLKYAEADVKLSEQMASGKLPKRVVPLETLEGWVPPVSIPIVGEHTEIMQRVGELDTDESNGQTE